MEQTEEEVKKTLDKLFENTDKTIEEQNDLRMKINEYIEDGYNVMKYVHMYNRIFGKG